MTQDDNKDRQRAQQAAKIRALMESANEEWPMRCELIRYQVREARQRFLELQKVGFNDAQALDLCWRQM